MIRGRLSDISWWMRLLSQHIAQRVNKEDGEIGKFWQARYRAVRLLDETAILACAAYVDLNPIRAALAETIEGSDFTSAQKRAAWLRRQCSVASVQCSVFRKLRRPRRVPRRKHGEQWCSSSGSGGIAGRCEYDRSMSE